MADTDQDQFQENQTVTNQMAADANYGVRSLFDYIREFKTEIRELRASKRDLEKRVIALERWVYNFNDGLNNSILQMKNEDLTQAEPAPKGRPDPIRHPGKLVKV